MAGEYQVRLSRRAKRDLDGILHYLLTSHSRQAAENAFAALTDSINGLARIPERHPRFVPGSELLGQEVRWVNSKKKYKVYFTVEEDKRGVLLLRILHVKAGLGRVLGALEEE